MRGIHQAIRAFCLGISAIAISSGVHAATPTAAQLQMFQQLSPAQQQALMQQLQSGGQATVQSQPLETPQLVTPRAVSTDTVIEQEIQKGADAASLTEEQKSKDVQQELKQFGYDLFAGVPTTFAPATDIPVPLDYVIGPGDTVEVQLFGKENVQYTLVVSRDGRLNFPNIGPVSVAGLSFQELKEALQERIKRQMIGVAASITMGSLRSIRVFILGDAQRPGSYTVSALSTMTNALFVSGGIRSIGSLRDIQLKRKGKIVTSLDLYDLLLHGDTSKDARLQPGDVIFVPPIGTTIGVAGEVRRPAIYELKDEKKIYEAVAFAGGLLPTAYPKASQLERISPRGDRTLIDVDLSLDVGRMATLSNGDVLRVYSVLEKMEDIVLLEGHVQRPGGAQWFEGMRLTDLVASVDDLLPQPDLGYVLIRREMEPDRKIKVLTTQLGLALENPESRFNVPLQQRDQVFVFGMEQNREETLNPIIEQLKQQARHTDPAKVVSISGNIYHPGEYPLTENMRIGDLVRASGQLTEAAYSLGAELSRHEVVEGKYRKTTHIAISLADALAGNLNANILLEPYDRLIIKRLPEWVQQETVEIQGEVLFPGAYPIRKGETLYELIQRAGGLTEFAFAEGAVFMREELRRKEQQQMDDMAGRLEADLAAMSLEQAQATDKEKQQPVVLAKGLLNQLRSARAAGRLVIDLQKVVENESEIVLQDGDKLFVPSQKQEVSILGEVQYPTSHLYQPNLDVSDYISRSGGLTYKADDGRIYVVRANGSVEPANGGWFGGGSPEVRPGDTIIAPLDAERMRPLTLWTSVTQILYQLGVAAAAWNTVGVF